ncbi:hypothetical protein AFK69_05430 [Xenorhabdus sp. GDc328]|nr:hypothetical protein AFK69_05430 [Xenorhabdus sp. GDc328]
MNFVNFIVVYTCIFNRQKCDEDKVDDAGHNTICDKNQQNDIDLFRHKRGDIFTGFVFNITLILHYCHND